MKITIDIPKIPRLVYNSKPVWRTSRKTKLTLSQIRKLRKMIDVRNYEKAKHLTKVRNQYGAKPEEGAGPTI